MTVATSLSPESTEALITSVFLANGYELPSSDKPSQIELSIHRHAHGCIIREVWTNKRWERSVGEAFADAVVSEGGWVLMVSAGQADCVLTRWDEAGKRESTTATPQAGGLNLEQREERAERALVLDRVGDKLGGAKRTKPLRLRFRKVNRTPLGEVLAAVAGGGAVDEMQVGGKPAFRFAYDGGRRILVLADDEAARVRDAVAARA